MSVSLLLALLETQEDNEPDYTRDYYTWIGAKWDGQRWINGNEEKREVVLRLLYDVLRSAINVGMPQSVAGPQQQNVQMPQSVALGTVLARAISEDEILSLQTDVKQQRTDLRAQLRAEMIRHLHALMSPPPAPPPSQVSV